MAEADRVEQPIAGTGRAEQSSPDDASYRLSLPAFEGPLDLLLHLIRKHEIDIYDIPIVLITDQYNAYLGAMEELDLEIAADYLYMAALLVHIKSKMLLPARESGDVEGESEDPRAELVRRLVEYQKYKAVAETFAEIDVVRIGVWSRPVAMKPDPGEETPELDMSEVSLFDLVGAFHTAMQRYRSAHPAPLELRRSVHRVSDKMNEVMSAVAEASEPIGLLWYLEGRDRPELVAIFLGMLELVRLGGISIRQDSRRGLVIQRTDREITADQLSDFEDA